MFRIRFHGRGGSGIKTASRILGTAFFRAGFHVQDAPVYGAERRGAPMLAYVRAARFPIQERGVMTHPDLVVVADETLVLIPAANVLAGVTDRTVFFVSSDARAATWQARLNLQGAIITLPLSRELSNHAEQAHIGAMCAGVAARLVGCVPRETLAGAIQEELGELGDAVVDGNLDRALGAYDAAAAYEEIVPEGLAISANGYPRPEWVDLPFEPAGRSAPAVHRISTSVFNPTGAWRTARPVVDYAQCKGCTWICSTLCPDSAIAVTADHRPWVDYMHCKGCLVCVAVCPHHAISAVPESVAVARAPS